MARDTKTPEAAPDSAIVIKGARAHNLKNISVEIPRDQLVVITGPSGSGKSSLAFDTIYAEGQRRYVESLSAYARQFLDQLEKPEVDLISGLSPTISIEQRTTSYNPRSTVGTVTEVFDYLRLLYSRVSKPFCWKCGSAIRSQSPQQIVDHILSYGEGAKLSILAPIVQGRKGEYQKELAQLRSRGFVRVRVDGEIRDLSEDIELDRNKKHSIEAYVDRIIVKGDAGVLATRVSDSVDLALKLGTGQLLLEAQADGQTTETLFSEKFSCPNCHLSYPSPEPRTFSFNSPMGACPSCDGLGVEAQPEESEDEPIASEESATSVRRKAADCPTCKGARLRKESLSFLLNDRNIDQLCRLSIQELAVFFTKIELTSRENQIADKILKEIRDRLGFLNEIGVHYLSLARAANSLSGGEAQRIRLATQIGSSLVGVIYVLDEPSIGLHQRDNDRLLATLGRLRDLGNTVLVVEHDKDTMEKADYIVDMGIGAGTQGGEIIAVGTYDQIKKSKKSVTGKYLRGELEIPVPKTRRKPDPARQLTVHNATQNNLRKVDVAIPLGLFTCVTGVSGSGKSTLVLDTLYRHLMKALYESDVGEMDSSTLSGTELIDKVIDIDQSPIGKTPRSNPATYIGVFTLIRDLFANLPESKVRGYAPGRYSFNVKGGRCEACEGDGTKKIEMHFLPAVYVRCDVCRGNRYNRETLDVRYKGKNIAEVLQMTGAEALEFFDAVPWIKAKLTTLNQVGLGYLQLGQSSTTLSGGEAQRIKLCKELSRRSTGKTLYILDEPSTGLHFDDVKKLVDILHTLVDQGNTVIVIEHNLDIIKTADHLIDLGPEGGAGGGQILAIGTPEKIASVPASHTGRFLRPYLAGVTK